MNKEDLEILKGALSFVVSFIVIFGLPYLGVIIDERKSKKREDISKGLKKVKMVCSCGQEYPDGCKFCAVDGKVLRRVVYDNSKLICPQCKKEFPNDAKYCPEHGELLIKVAK